MKNVSAKVEGKFLHITIDLSATRSPSKTGKSLVVASTEGNVEVEGAPGLRLGLNAYEAAPKA